VSEPVRPDAGALRIAYLEAQVEALEAALTERSRELRRLQDALCAKDLVQLSRLRSGLPPLPRGAYEPGFWRETTELRPAEVEETLDDLWRWLYRRADGAGELGA
jgi:hypothetical protein